MTEHVISAAEEREGVSLALELFELLKSRRHSPIVYTIALAELLSIYSQNFKNPPGVLQTVNELASRVLGDILAGRTRPRLRLVKS